MEVSFLFSNLFVEENKNTFGNELYFLFLVIFYLILIFVYIFSILIFFIDNSNVKLDFHENEIVWDLIVEVLKSKT